MKHTRNSSPSRVAGARAAAQRTQSGVALIVALILLVVITVIGLAAIRTSTLQEKMAGNTFDRAQAFQVAEATLQLAYLTNGTNFVNAGTVGTAWNTVTNVRLTLTLQTLTNPNNKTNSEPLVRTFDTTIRVR